MGGQGGDGDAAAATGTANAVANGIPEPTAWVPGQARASASRLARSAPAHVALEGDDRQGWLLTVALDARPVRALLDTGSSTLAVACDDCVNCGDVARYRPSLPPDGDGRLSFGRYADGSGWRARCASARLTVAGARTEGPATPAQMWLACVQRQEGNFLSELAARAPDADGACRLVEPPGDGTGCASGVSDPGGPSGVLGLGPDAGASLGTDAPRRALLAARGADHDAFTLHLRRKGGTLYLGGFPLTPAAAAWPSATAAWLPLVGAPHDARSYAIAVAGLRVGGTALPWPTDPMQAASTLDTGTSALLLPPATEAALRTALDADPNVVRQLGRGFFTRRDRTCGRWRAPTRAPPTSDLSRWGRATVDATLPTLAFAVVDVDGRPHVFRRTATQAYLSLTAPTALQPHWTACATVAPAHTAVLGSNVLSDTWTTFDVSGWQLGLAPVHE